MSFSARDAEEREVGGGEGGMRIGGWEVGWGCRSRRRAVPIKNDSRLRTRQGTERKKRDYAGKTERILAGEMELGKKR